MNQIKQFITEVAGHEKTPLVLTIISCTGVVVTAIMTARAAPKAAHILAELRADPLESDPLPFLHKVKHTWKIYVPAASLGLATMASIITMNRVSDRNVAILTAGATLATNTLKDYQQHILEEIGAEKESKVRDRMARNALAKVPVPESELGFVYTDGEVLFFDALSGRYFKHNLEKVRGVENDFNHELLNSMSMSLNDLYDALGLESIEVGEMLGFNTDNMLDFHFSAQLSPDKKPAVVLGHINMPVPNYDK